MRLFVAVYPPAAVVDEFSAFVATLAVGRAAADGINARLASTASWHVTLAFLGEVPDARLADARTALETAAHRARIDEPLSAGPLFARIAGGGRFGRGRFTILWAGVRTDVAAGQPADAGSQGDAGRPAPVRHRVAASHRDRTYSDPLRGLAAVVLRELKRAKLPFDDKPFRPHLTLARPGDRLPAEAISADLAALSTYESPQWIIDEVALVRSQLGPKPTYDRLGTWPLGA